ncbi:hypothetical protein [Sodalinema gerasimenkoae]|uniref:hypothetical protein n=1 Tax=Sodalinema gerasimenkoae TaxID=2862348 RepID=UPI0013567A95|nr:hypothetical protein [Sodalinema gerasimenkoae]
MQTGDIPNAMSEIGRPDEFLDFLYEIQNSVNHLRGAIEAGLRSSSPQEREVLRNLQELLQPIQTRIESRIDQRKQEEEEY